MKQQRTPSVIFAVTMAFSLLLSVVGGVYAEDEAQFFEAQVAPLLRTHCIDCHGPDTQESELRLDDYGAMLRGGEIGPAVVPGQVDRSLLVTAVGYKDEVLQMPPDGKLPAEAIEVFRKWVEMGAPHPQKGQVDPVAHHRMNEQELAEARSFWSFQPVVRPEVPEMNASWGTNEIDRLLLADLKQQGLVPAPPASKRELIRRATFDLTGLPPTPAEIEEFLADSSPDAFAKVIDRLLESTAYGERWGRHWLDIVRYADSNGLDENVAHGNAWRYRDYVIASFNADKPFDQFLQEQIAGDLIEGPSERRHDRLIATGFLTLGAKVLAESDETKMQMDIVDEQIDTIGKSLLGLTLGCARCHDHKFDPISTADYYALAGIFKSTRTMESLKRIAKWNEVVIASEEELAAKAEHEQKVAAKQGEIDALIKDANAALVTKEQPEPPKDAETKYPEETKTRLAALRAELKALQESVPTLTTAMGVTDGDVANVPVHVRGSHLTLGREVERGIPVVLETQEVSIPNESSGRLAFAKWLVAPENPLTARVMANRLWRWHFGKGLVGSANNFGQLGERPINQPLLDWLAAEFMESGWSVKQMHRLMMTSQAYQMSSQDNPVCSEIDPGNLHHWRAEVRRLEAEAIRDSLLAVSGQLDLKMGGSLLHVGNREFIFNHTSKDETNYDANCRSVYLPVIRNNLYDGFSLFDYTDAAVPNGDRATSTVATQALFILNSDLVLKSAEQLAARLLEDTSRIDEQHVNQLYKITLGRCPTDEERSRMLLYLETEKADGMDSHQAWTALCHVVLASNEFLYVK
ncbi:MAG: DUF1549 domain-containing protein [Planctomycetaceae bacterium]|nr:DUF1549 domain-containing protein [Planctomycetaceae bacterium]